MANKEKLYSEQNIRINREKLQHIHDVVSLVLGVGCGILSLESWKGFLFYVVGTFLTNVVVYHVCCEGRSKSFFHNPLQDIFFEGLMSDIPGFAMMWCLVYTLVR